MDTENITIAIQNFVLSFYRNGDVISAYEAAGDFLDNEEELNRFDKELLEYLTNKSSIVVEGYNGVEFFPIKLGINTELQYLISYIEEKL